MPDAPDPLLLGKSAKFMTLKICVAQLNFVVGDLTGNAQRIVVAAQEAHLRARHADLKLLDLSDIEEITLLDGHAIHATAEQRQGE